MSKKKKEHKVSPASYYFQGVADQAQFDMMCKMLHQGITVYHQFGKPQPPLCPPGQTC